MNKQEAYGIVESVADNITIATVVKTVVQISDDAMFIIEHPTLRSANITLKLKIKSKEADTKVVINDNKSMRDTRHKSINIAEWFSDTFTEYKAVRDRELNAKEKELLEVREYNLKLLNEIKMYSSNSWNVFNNNK